MPLRIRLGRRAKNDQRSIWQYVAQDNVTAADQLIERFAESFRMLAVHPEAGRLLSELSADLRAFPVARTGFSIARLPRSSISFAFYTPRAT